MNDLVYILKTQEILRTSRARYKRVIEADLVIIDDLMFMAMERAKGLRLQKRSKYE